MLEDGYNWMAVAERVCKERDELRTALLAILNVVDYANGTCRITTAVGTALSKSLIDQAWKALGDIV